MDRNPFEEPAGEFRRAMEQHTRRLREEMDRAREQMQAATERARIDMDRARSEFERQMDEVRQHMKPGNASIDEPLRANGPSSKRRRPRRKPPGGEPAPVKPRPNPTPLTDGAEAPVE